MVRKTKLNVYFDSRLQTGRWVSRLLHAKQENWTLIPNLLLKKVMENFQIFRMNLNNQSLKKLNHLTKDIPEFKNFTFERIHQIKTSYKENINIQIQIINCSIKKKFFKHWHK